MTSPGRRLPDMMERARDELARRAEAQHPGWTLHHGLYGWTGVRISDGLTRCSSSLPGLCPLITSVSPDNSPSWTSGSRARAPSGTAAGSW